MHRSNSLAPYSKDKNDTDYILLKKIVLNLPRFFTHCPDEGKRAANSKPMFFSLTKRSRSYIVLALVPKAYGKNKIFSALSNLPREGHIEESHVNKVKPTE